MTKQEMMEQVKLMQTELVELRSRVREYEGSAYGSKLKDMFGRLYNDYIDFMNSIMSDVTLTKEVK